MAAFCSKCGTPLTSTTGFCAACGTPIPAEAAAPPAAAPPPAAFGGPPPPVGYPAYPPKSSNSALKIVLIVIAVVVVLGIAAAGSMAFIAYHALHTGGNSLAIGKSADVDESDLGVAIYPGATHLDSGGMKMKAGGNLVVSSTYTTSDPVDAVVAFYRSKLGGTVQESQNGRGASLVSATAESGVKESIVVNVSPGSDATGSVTRIVILHTKTPASQ